MHYPVAVPGGREGHGPAGPVKISHQKDGRWRRPHRFHVSRPLPLPGRWIRYCNRSLDISAPVSVSRHQLIWSVEIPRYFTQSGIIPNHPIITHRKSNKFFQIPNKDENTYAEVLLHVGGFSLMTLGRNDEYIWHHYWKPFFFMPD